MKVTELEAGDEEVALPLRVARIALRQTHSDLQSRPPPHPARMRCRKVSTPWPSSVA